MKYHPFINGLRAIAVVPVILFHYEVRAFSGGYAGVDVFFVISGFLITGLLMGMLEKREFSLLTFYERRARRILPALFFTCFLTFGFCWFYFLPDDFAKFGRALAGAAAFASNFVFAGETGYFATPALVEPLLHTWSLAVEEQFYIFYPLILYALYRAVRGKRDRLAACLGALLLASFALNLHTIAHQPADAFYLLHTRAWELLAGALTFLWLKDVKLNAACGELAGIAGFALLLFSFFYYDAGTPFPGWAAVAPVLGTVLLIWPNLQRLTLTGRILSTRPTVAVGLVSYAMYLYHWPILVISRYYLQHSLTGLETGIAIGCTGALAAATYFLFEQPVRERRMLAPRRAIFAFSLTGLLALGIAGVVAAKAEGFPGRFPSTALQYVTDDKSPPQECTPAGEGFGLAAEKCRIGDLTRSKPAFLVWGDSHADALAPGLSAVAKQRGKMGLMIWAAGCTPLVNLDRPQRKIHCPAENDAVIRFIRDQKIKTVILIARWDLALPYEEGGLDGSRNGKGPRLALRTEDGRKVYDLDAFAGAFRDTLAALKQLGVRVWVVKQAPSYLEYVSTALAEYAARGRDVTELNRPLDEVLRRRAPIDAVFDQVRDPSVGFIDPVKKLCADGKNCLASVNGHSLYRDDTHVSVYGALWLRDMWLPVVTAMK